MSLAGKQVLVTGATGFLGGALARRLIQEGAHVRVLARFAQKAASLVELGAATTQGDLTDHNSLYNAAENCEIVFHVAVNYGSLEKQTAVNVEGTRALAKASALAGVSRFVHVSTIAAYGSGANGDIYESRPLIPAAYHYAVTKAQGEAVVQQISAETGLPYTIIRPGMIYGINAATWTNGLYRLATNKPSFWLDDGHGSAHMIHVDDVVDLMVVASTHPAAVNEAFNCSADPTPTWREVMTRYANIGGIPEWKPINIGVPLYIFAGLAMLFSTPISLGRDLPDLLGLMGRQVTFKMTKAREKLGWQPHVDLASGIESTAQSLYEKYGQP